MRLIDADEFLKNEIERCGCVPVIGSCTADNEIFKFILEKQPTIEAAPVVHGEWIAGKLLFENDVCSVCGTGIYNTLGMNFCPNCGAKMRTK